MTEKKNSSHQKPSDKKINRRDFLKNISLATAGFSIVPRHVLGGSRYVAPSDTLYIASVGTGGKGKVDVGHLGELDNTKIAYLCDVDDRQSNWARKHFPDAPYYHDWRRMFDKEHDHFDAVSVSTPDHNHAIVGMHAMQRDKHVYIQKPLSHDIYEARMLTRAAKKYNVVTQMGDQGTSGDDIRTVKEWHDAGIIGEVSEVYCWTDRPIWPQGVSWPDKHPKVPKGLKWDLWLGTAPYAKYSPKFVPQKWRGWWPFGTGAMGDMGCHLIGPVFKALELDYPEEVSSKVSTIYDGWGSEAYYPKSAPLSSVTHFKYDRGNGRKLTLHWMTGGIQPERPSELKPNEKMGGGSQGILFIGSRGKIMAGNHAHNPRLLPVSMTDSINVSQKYPRVNNGETGHYKQWVDACLSGDGNAEGASAFGFAGYEGAIVDSPFIGHGGPLTESVLMGNLAIRSFNYRVSKKNKNGKIKGYSYPGRGKTLKWDAQNMRVTNFDPANQYVKRDYRKGWEQLEV